MTTIGGVKAALIAIGTAIYDPTTTSVGYSGRAVISREYRLLVGDIEGDTEVEAMGTTRPVKEEYDVRCVISATSNGSVDDQQRITEQVISMWQALDVAIRGSTQQNLGVTGVRVAGITGSWSLKEAQASETAGPINTSLEFRVHVEANYRLP
jgi:hypothetical protein